MRKRGLADRLFDIPQADGVPLHIFSRHVEDGQRDVICGVVCQPEEERLPPAVANPEDPLVDRNIAVVDWPKRDSGEPTDETNPRDP